jgi:hypothetical protein
MFKVKLKNINDGERQEVTVWAETKREANLQSLKVARKLLHTSASFEVLQTLNLSPGGDLPRPKQARTKHPLDGPVLTRFAN